MERRANLRVCNSARMPIPEGFPTLSARFAIVARTSDDTCRQTPLLYIADAMFGDEEGLFIEIITQAI